MAKHRDVHDSTDPAELQPERRLTEVAAILARGILRMRELRRASASIPEISPKSGETRLEVSRRSSPDGQSG